jgi:hypothetical protein
MQVTDCLADHRADGSVPPTPSRHRRAAVLRCSLRPTGRASQRQEALRQAPVGQRAPGLQGARPAPSGRTMTCAPHTAGRPTTRTPHGLISASPAEAQRRPIPSAMPRVAFPPRPGTHRWFIRPGRSPHGTAARPIASAAAADRRQGTEPADARTRPSSPQRRSRRTSSTRITHFRRSRIRFPARPAEPQPRSAVTSARPACLAAGPGTADLSATMSRAGRFRPCREPPGRGERAVLRGGPARSASRPGWPSEPRA